MTFIHDPGGEFWLIEGEPVGLRIHIAFRARTRQRVDDFSCRSRIWRHGQRGAGLRIAYHPDYYACFVLDPDGYNIEAVVVSISLLPNVMSTAN